MWMIAEYLPVSFFSLKPAGASSSGGKTLLIPTPFAIKMALLSSILCSRGRVEGERVFPFLRDLQLAIAPPESIVVQKSLSKIRREMKERGNIEKAQRAHAKKEFPMQQTIAYREYVSYTGSLRMACQMEAESPLSELLSDALLQLNYLGKRGSFLQIADAPTRQTELPGTDFIHLTGTALQPVPVGGTPQMLDDCGGSLTFNKANIYTPDTIELHQDRILRHIVLPYTESDSGRTFSLYQRIPRR